MSVVYGPARTLNNSTKVGIAAKKGIRQQILQHARKEAMNLGSDTRGSITCLSMRNGRRQAVGSFVFLQWL